MNLFMPLSFLWQSAPQGSVSLQELASVAVISSAAIGLITYFTSLAGSTKGTKDAIAFHEKRLNRLEDDRDTIREDLGEVKVDVGKIKGHLGLNGGFHGGH